MSWFSVEGVRSLSFLAGVPGALVWGLWALKIKDDVGYSNVLDLTLEVLVGWMVLLCYQNLHSLIIYLQAVPFVLVSFRSPRRLSILILSPFLLGSRHIVLTQDSLCG